MMKVKNVMHKNQKVSEGVFDIRKCSLQALTILGNAVIDQMFTARSCNNRATCLLYDQLDAVLGIHASTISVVLLESSQPIAVEEKIPEIH